MSPTMSSGPAPPGLTSRERAILDLERCWWTEGWPTKEAAIRDRLGMSKAQYYAALDAVVGTATGFAYDPLVVLRVRRAKQVRRRARFEGRSTGDPAR